MEVLAVHEVHFDTAVGFGGCTTYACSLTNGRTLEHQQKMWLVLAMSISSASAAIGVDLGMYQA
jgi:hypothetical protein